MLILSIKYAFLRVIFKYLWLSKIFILSQNLSIFLLIYKTSDYDNFINFFVNFY